MLLHATLFLSVYYRLSYTDSYTALSVFIKILRLWHTDAWYKYHLNGRNMAVMKIFDVGKARATQVSAKSSAPYAEDGATMCLGKYHL